MNILKLKAKMIEHGYTQRSLAHELGMNKNTLNSRINGESSFRVDEVEKVCVLLDITTPEEKCAIFLQ